VFLPRVRYWSPVTPDDAAALPVSLGLYVTTGGAVAFQGDGGGVVTVTVPDGFFLWGDVRLVKATGTTASGIFHLRG
jgi:hypothetical protein